jgi:hypothetical protein
VSGPLAGFPQALAGPGPLFLGILALHVAAGLTAVAAGAVAAAAPKRHGRHTRAGTVYYQAVTVVAATATALTSVRPARDWYLLLLGGLTLGLAAAGRHTRRHPDARPWRRWPGRAPHIVAMGSSYTVLLTAFYVDNGKRLPLWDRLPVAAYWLLPAAVAVPLMCRTLARHRGPRPRRPADPPRGRL